MDLESSFVEEGGSFLEFLARLISQAIFLFLEIGYFLSFFFFTITILIFVNIPRTIVRG